MLTCLFPSSAVFCYHLHVAKALHLTIPCRLISDPKAFSTEIRMRVIVCTVVTGPKLMLICKMAGSAVLITLSLMSRVAHKLWTFFVFSVLILGGNQQEVVKYGKIC